MGGHEQIDIFRRPVSNQTASIQWFFAREIPPSAVAAREQELRTDLEALGPGHEEPEGTGQPIDRIEGEADRERVLDLVARDAGSQHRASSSSEVRRRADVRGRPAPMKQCARDSACRRLAHRVTHRVAFATL
jgi:hypothetical protein